MGTPVAGHCMLVASSGHWANYPGQARPYVISSGLDGAFPGTKVEVRASGGLWAGDSLLSPIRPTFQAGREGGRGRDTRLSPEGRHVTSFLTVTQRKVTVVRKARQDHLKTSRPGSFPGMGTVHSQVLEMTPVEAQG